jgi:hypothetical protein
MSGFEGRPSQPIEKVEEMSVLEVDRKSPEIVSALAGAAIYKKQGRVNARPANDGEQITTTLKSGMNETINTANEGDWVVTDPSGEQYITPKKKFLSRYEPSSEDGIYEARGYIRAIKNPFSKPIQIMASWGEKQNGNEHCWIADVSDVSGNTEGEPYIIEADAFSETYKEVQAP